MIEVLGNPPVEKSLPVVSALMMTTMQPDTFTGVAQ